MPFYYIFLWLEFSHWNWDRKIVHELMDTRTYGKSWEFCRLEWCVNVLPSYWVFWYLFLYSAVIFPSQKSIAYLFLKKEKWDIDNDDDEFVLVWPSLWFLWCVQYFSQKSYSVHQGDWEDGLSSHSQCCGLQLHYHKSYNWILPLNQFQWDCKWGH